MIALSAGTIFAHRYRIVRLIGQGGMGAVFEVVHVETERRCALKLMQSNMVENDAMRARFRQEAKVAALVNSEHIVDVYDAGIDESTGMPFLVMELLAGIELRQHLKNLKRLRPEDVALYMYQAALALDKTHRANIIHRDLKPENLFLTFRENGAPHVKILDFGVAKFVSEAGAHANATREVGTPLYMAPEQFTVGGHATPQADIYALGMMTYTLLTGGSYWLEDNQISMTIYTLAILVVQGPQEPATVRALRRGVQLPPAFDIWFARATAKKAEDRYPTAIMAANELADAFGIPRAMVENTMSIPTAKLGVLASTGSGSSAIGMTSGDRTGSSGSVVTTAVPNPAPPGLRNGVAIAAGAISALLVVTIGVMVYLQRQSPPSKDQPAPMVSAGPQRNADPAATDAAVVVASSAPSSVASVASVVSSSVPTTASPKSTAKSSTSVKPITTVAPSKDLFTRD